MYTCIRLIPRQALSSMMKDLRCNVTRNIKRSNLFWVCNLSKRLNYYSFDILNAQYGTKRAWKSDL